MPADVLGSSIGVQARDVNMITHALTRDRLIGKETRKEARDPNAGPVPNAHPVLRNYFFLDRKVFLDVTKWRMMKMRAQIDNVLRNELDNKGYKCPQCGKSYNTLDVAALLDPRTMMTFLCDVPGCGSELVDNEDAEDVRRSKDRLKRFNEQCGPILDRLRKIDGVTLPAFHLESELARNGNSEVWRLRALRRENPNATMNDVREARGAVPRAASVEIDMATDDPAQEAARRQRREAEAEKMRQANALPQWWETTQDPNAPRSHAERSTDAGRERQPTETEEQTDALRDDCKWLSIRLCWRRLLIVCVCV